MARPLWFVKLLEKTFPNIKVVLFTVKGSEEDIATGKEAGADAHIVKPTARREILQTIHKTLKGEPFFLEKFFFSFIIFIYFKGFHVETTRDYYNQIRWIISST